MFHSQELNKAIAALEPLAGNFRSKADQVSDDIRALEKYLQEKFVGIEISINVVDHKLNEDHLTLLNLAGMGNNLDFLLKEFLTWGKDETSGKFRLLYETHSLKSDKANGFQIWPEKKPLIECPLFWRLRMHAYLPMLIDHITKVLS